MLWLKNWIVQHTKKINTSFHTWVLILILKKYSLKNFIRLRPIIVGRIVLSNIIISLVYFIQGLVESEKYKKDSFIVSVISILVSFDYKLITVLVLFPYQLLGIGPAVHIRFIEYLI